MKNLIEKYFKGETSLQEEAELTAYFRSGNVDESLLEYQSLFQFFPQAKELKVSEGFEGTLFKKLESTSTDIAALIEKYFEGNSSQEEEAAIKAYFNEGTVDESLKMYQPLFQHFENETANEVSADFDEQFFKKMEHQNSIQLLVDKYFEGSTTLEEEKELKNYFSTNEIDNSLEQYQPLFQYFETKKTQQVSKDFDKKFFEKVENSGAKIVPMKRFQRRLMRVAAVAAVLLGTFILFQPTTPSGQGTVAIDWSAHEINDEQLAYEETVKALRLLSSKLNKGKNKTAKEVAKAEPVTRYLN